MKWMWICVRTTAPLALAAAMVLPVSALGADKEQQDEQQTAQDSQEAQQSQEKEARQLRVFELKHRQPQELTQIIALRATPALPAQRAAGYRGVADSRVLTASSAEQKLLFVRGSQGQLDEIGKLIDALDVPDDQLQAHDYAKCRLIPIHSKDAGPVQAALMQLELQGQMIRIGQVSFMAFRMDDGDDQKRQQAEEVIKRLDTRMKNNDQDQNAEEQPDSEEDQPDEQQQGNNGSSSR